MKKIILYSFICFLSLSVIRAENIFIFGTYNDPTRETRGVEVPACTQFFNALTQAEIAKKMLQNVKEGDTSVFFRIYTETLTEENIFNYMIVWQKLCLRYNLPSYTELVGKLGDSTKIVPIFFNKHLNQYSWTLIIKQWNKFILSQENNQKTQIFNSTEQFFKGLKTLKQEQQTFPLQIKIIITKDAFKKDVKGSFFDFMYHLDQAARPSCEIEKQNILYQIILNNDSI